MVEYRWKRGRVVEGARLEIVWAGNRLEGSNPFASATRKCAQKARFVLRFTQIESFFATRKRAFFVALFLF